MAIVLNKNLAGHCPAGGTEVVWSFNLKGINSLASDRSFHLYSIKVDYFVHGLTVLSDHGYNITKLLPIRSRRSLNFITPDLMLLLRYEDPEKRSYKNQRTEVLVFRV